MEACFKEEGKVFHQVKLEKLKLQPSDEDRKAIEDLIITIVEMKSQSKHTDKLEDALNSIVDRQYQKLLYGNIPL